MNGHVGRTLFANLWKQANPLFRGTGTQGLSSSSRFSQHSSTLNNAFQNAFGKRLPRASSSSPFSTYPRNPRQITRRFASGGFFVLTTGPNSTAAVEPGTACAISSEKITCHGVLGQLDQRRLTSLGRAAWSRSFHTSKRRAGQGRTGSKEPHGNNSVAEESSLKRGEASTKPETSNTKTTSTSPHTSASAANHYLRTHLHRPTREELLAAATGFWSRLKVRFKWFSIRSVRPFNMDEIGAFFSWVLLGHVLWVILGTTTFFSLLILAINTVFAQGMIKSPELTVSDTNIITETLAGWVGNYLTKSSGTRVVFESAIVPKWKDGVITFKNVFVSRRPGQGAGNVSKGSSKTAAAAAAAFVTQPTNTPPPVQEEEDTNYTQFDISIDSVNVTLSFNKWFNGKGLLGDVEVKGIRGVVDRTHVHWAADDLDPKSYRHEHNPGDFEIDSFKMEDVLVTIYQPNGFRPYSVSIYSCDLPQLRRQWLFYDFLSANMMSGSFDNSLFTIHPRQTHSYTGAQLNNGVEENGKANPWKKHSRIRIDGLNIDHLNRGVQGPFSWIHEGNVDIVADMMFPADNDESIAKVMSDFYDRLEATVTSNRYQLAPGEQSETGAEDVVRSAGDEDRRFLVTDLRIHLNNVRAVVPIFTKDLSYINNALIRPIVAYINSRRTFIPINCRLVKRVSDFDGSWTIFDSALMDDLSAETYEAFARDVVDDQARMRRFKKVGFWSLQLAAQAIFMGMAGNIA
ncbi:Mitochondrial distribution and morphology protein 31, mitochondrial precursor [Arachnomyces sp. PD_36]|nr:Mitochondrial distribution and morphology protein 31, mitochondrial precursor [Arachnomyces sp. PD_36]